MTFKAGDVVRNTVNAWTGTVLWTDDGEAHVERADGVRGTGVNNSWVCSERLLDKIGEVSEPQTPPATGRVIPDDDNREDYPLFDVLFGYFPAAMCELSHWAKVGNDKHNPGEELHWARDKSTDHANKIARHLMDYDQKDGNGFYEAIPLLWRAAALAQELLEKDGWPEGRRSRRMR